MYSLELKAQVKKGYVLSKKIRRDFLKYFIERNHVGVPSSPLFSPSDPSLLFTNAGMNQFKDIFLGNTSPDYENAVSVQKCLRVGGKHNDLENVGHTSRHITFFEMLGNFSFGGYFKKEAIRYGYEVTTTVFGFSPDRLWVTVFEDDSESLELWKEWMPASRIIKMGASENFWQMGDYGPCGPCSELLYDRGPQYGNAPSPKEDISGERYLEFWNLVFMQDNKEVSGKVTKLPKPCIDTGVGLERVVSLSMGVESVFETDILFSLIQNLQEIFSIPYTKEQSLESASFRVIADHIRALSFAISDGAIPGNTDRGYILRKLLRRSIIYSKNLGATAPFHAKLVPPLIELMGEDYPELVASRSKIEEILTLEEENFFKILQRGGNLIEPILQKATKRSSKQIEGNEAFLLKDTYGLPFDEIVLLAKDRGLTIDVQKYANLEREAKDRSRKSATFSTKSTALQLDIPLLQDVETTFVGYKTDAINTSIVAISHSGHVERSIHLENPDAIIILKETPFYAEKGGQVSDTGILQCNQGEFYVQDTKFYKNVIAHIGKLIRGTLSVGDSVHASIDVKRRRRIEETHSATHLLNFALSKILGSHIRQAGSFVDVGRLRYDFTHHKGLTELEIRNIEQLVQEKIAQNHLISTTLLPLAAAQKDKTIIQAFGEKYGSEVRVVNIHDVSRELCGGTHAASTGSIGLFRIIKESSIGTGIRRIEACIGLQAQEFMYKREDILHEVSKLLEVPIAKIPVALVNYQKETLALREQIKRFAQNKIHAVVIELVKKSEKIHSTSIFASQVEIEKESLMTLSNTLIEKSPSSAIFLIVQHNQSYHILVRLTLDLIKKGLAANQLLQDILHFMGGRGGGNISMAQGAAKSLDRLSDAFILFNQKIKEQC